MKDIDNLRKVIQDNKTVFAPTGWTPKRDAYFKVMKEIIEQCSIETVLNVGVGPELSALKWNRVICDIFPVQHVENLDLDAEAIKKAKASNQSLIMNVTLGDVKDIAEIFPEKSFDLIYWNQGPEHIYRPEREETFKALDIVADKAIFMHCPWGTGYDYDVWHYSKNIQKGEFEKFGFQCIYHGVKDSKNTGIMSYKIL